MKQAVLRVEELVTSEGQQILVIDKQGHIGFALAKELSPVAYIHVVSKRRLTASDGKKVAASTYNEKKLTVVSRRYTCIFIVYNGEEEIVAALPQLIEYARVNEIKIFLIASYRVYTAAMGNYVTSYKHATIILVGDVFGHSVVIKNVKKKKHTFISVSLSPVQHMLDQISSRGGLKLSHTGLTRVYPVYFSDCIDAILQIAFGSSRPSQLHLAFPKQQTTQLGIARLINKSYPTIAIDFVEAKSQLPHGLVPSGAIDFFATGYALEKKIKQAVGSLLSGSAQDQEGEALEEGQQASSKGLGKGIFFSLMYLCVVFVALPILVTGVAAALGVFELKSAVKQLEEGRGSVAVQKAEFAKDLFRISQKSISLLAQEAGFIGKSNLAAPVQSYIFLGRDGADAISSLAKSYTQFRSVFEGASQNPKDDFLSGVNGLKRGLLLVQSMRAQNERANSFIHFYFGSDELFLTDFMAATVDVFPTLFGFEGKKEYALLFQNNMELRPGGGFIGSFGLTSVNSGKAGDITVYDVYDADGQLKGHVEPPFALRRYLPTPHWYLRDSNFSLHWPDNASASAFFLKQELGKEVDGVIGIDISFMKKILEVVGPLRLVDYSETVTADNLYRLIQTHAERNYFPSSTQKKDIMRSIVTALSLRLSEKDISFIKLARAIASGLREKHLLIGFADSSLQKLFALQGVSSALLDSEPAATNGADDFLGISEANLGVNKANYYIKRKVNQKVIVQNDGTVKSALNLTYANTSREALWPGGEYKNYLRFILPKDVRIEDITIDHQKQQIIPAIVDPKLYEAKTFVAPKELEVTTIEQAGKTVVGFLISVPIASYKTVQLIYVLAKKVDTSQTFFTYRQNIFKQPGIDDFQYELVFDFPPAYTSMNASENRGWVQKGNSMRYSARLTTDTNMQVSFTKK